MFRLNNFIKEENAIGVVELVLIVVVLIGLVMIFKRQLTSLVNSIFQTINTRAGQI